MGTRIRCFVSLTPTVSRDVSEFYTSTRPSAPEKGQQVFDHVRVLDGLRSMVTDFEARFDPCGEVGRHAFIQISVGLVGTGEGRGKGERWGSG